MRHDRLLQRLRDGHTANVPFDDLLGLARAFGFRLDRTSGSHHALVHDQVPRPLVIQPDRNGDAKPYQLRQLVREIERYELSLKEGPS